MESPESRTPPLRHERPLPLTVLCLAGFAFCSLGMVVLYSPAILKMGKVYSLFRSLLICSLVVSFGGVWMMRRWSLWVLIGAFAANQAVGLAYGTWERSSLALLPLVLVTALYYRKMG